MYEIGDKVVHPMHGAGVISDIVLGGADARVGDYYVLHIASCGMDVMVPVASCNEIGVRPVIDREKADEILASIDDIETDSSQNWNKRYRENMVRIKSGDLLEVARVIKCLVKREKERGLSTGERKMLHSARQILISELVLARAQTRDEVEKVLSLVGL
jgi:CarD family transcriptional regulator